MNPLLVGAWAIDAPCTQVDPEVFFPEKGAIPRSARLVCSRCDVVVQCLEFALEYNLQGVWGGTGERQRDQIRRNRADAGEALCGTVAGYQRHVTEGETPCVRCRGAKGHQARGAAA